MASSLLESLSADDRAKAVKTGFPGWLDPMLATLTDTPFSDENWLFERKFDGERCLAYRNGEHTRLMSRNRKPLGGSYPEIADAIAQQLRHEFIVDGEIVAFEGEMTSFARLQNRMKLTDPEAARRSDVPVFYYVFDILYLDGYDVMRVPLRQRKALLQRALDFREPLRFTEHRDRDGKAFIAEACAKRWEGLIAKDAEAAYEHRRSRKWLKFKCVKMQEVVVGGFTDPEGSRRGFGALLVGYYKGRSLIYAGKIGTGFDDDTLRELRAKLDRLETDTAAFAADSDLPKHHVHWVQPKLVAQAKFTEWTRDGKLRHPVYLGLRDDKEPAKVTREEAK